MHVVVLGAGGLGGVIGARLASAGVDVTLVARPLHVAAIREKGLVVSGLHGDYVVRDQLRAVTDPAAVEGAIDYLILLTKTRGTASALESARPLIPRVEVALSLQNAVTKEDRLCEWIGSDRVIGATTTEAGFVTGPGAVRHVATAPTAFYFGELDGSSSDRTEQLAGQFSAAGMGASVTPHIQQAEWEKLLQISIVAGFSASTLGFKPGAVFAHGIATAAGAAHYTTIAQELLAVYRAMGYEPRDFFAPFSQFRLLASRTYDEAVADALALGRDMVARGVLGRPSLHEDIVHGRPTEVDDSLGMFIDAADRLGIEVPTARGAYRVIKTLEQLALDEA